MADGTNINVKITATGGDAAAAEIKKLDKAQAALAATTSTVTKQAVSMKTDWKNVGYQVQDVAVQVGAGTSAFRALGQQLPQLLSGFGPLGVTLGTVAAVALPLAGSLMAAGDAAGDAGEKAEAAAEKLKKLTEARQAKADAAAEASFKSYLDSLDLEFEKINRNNDAMQRGIDIKQAENRAKIEVQSSEAALALLEIDASDKTEAEKIQARAEVNKNLERQKLAAENEASKLNVDRAAGEATKATESAALAAGQVGRTGQTLAEQQAEADALREKVGAAEAAKQSLPSATAAAEKADIALRQARNQGQFGSSSQTASPKQLAELKSKADAAAAERDRLTKAAGGASLADNQRLATLQGEKQADGSFSVGLIDQQKKAVADLAKAAADMAIAAEKARLDAEKTDRTESTAIEARGTVAANRLKGIEITTRQSLGKEAEKGEKEAASEARKTGRRDLTTRQDNLDAGARSQGLEMRKTGRAEANDTYKSVESALLDGTNADELQKLGDQVREAAGKNGAATTAFLLQIIEGFNTQAKDIETLKRRLGNQ